MDSTRFLTPRQAGEVLQVSLPTLYALIHTGQLRAVRAGRQWRIPESALAEFGRATAVQS